MSDAESRQHEPEGLCGTCHHSATNHWHSPGCRSCRCSRDPICACGLLTSKHETNPSLTEFLLARFAEDEEIARAANECGASATCSDAAHGWYRVGELWERFSDVRRPDADADHIARHDPTRVLADVEAKRRIAELHDSVSYAAWCRSCGRPDMPNGAHEWPCATIRTLAQPYAAHPEFREEWAL